VESEQFAWQACRWGQQLALAPADGDLLMAALCSLGDIFLKDVQDIQKQQRSNSLSESDSKSGSSGDEAEPGASSRNVSTCGGTGDRQRDQNSGRCRETTSEGKKCGQRIAINPAGQNQCPAVSSASPEFLVSFFRQGSSGQPTSCKTEQFCKADCKIRM
jgi:hypothetical protein